MLLSAPRVNVLRTYGHLEPEAALQRLYDMGSQLNTDNPYKNAVGPVNDLRRCLGFWKALGATNTVISWLGYGIPPLFYKEPACFEFVSPPPSPEDAEVLAADFAAHTSDATFVLVPDSFPRIVSPRFVDTNVDGKKRCIDDMRYPNWFMPKITGKFMSLKNDAPSLIKPGDIIKVEDLEKAYYKIPVSKAAQAYQCFRGPDNRLYAITCLPFGHRLATWIFTKICQPLKAFFGVLKMPCFN
jgi:hypothetical protein